MNAAEQIAALKNDIAACCSRREVLKQRLAAAAERQARRNLWGELENVDKRLSILDSRYKQLWDTYQRDKP
jgi:predicted  nucleic acid-binding Zn-ribbon protein